MQRLVRKRRKQMSQQGVFGNLFSRLRGGHLVFWCQHLARSGGLQASICDEPNGPPMGASSFAFDNPYGRVFGVRGVVHALLIAGLFVCSPSAWAQISLVQMTTCASPGTSCTIPATGSGHLIVVGWSSAWGTIPTIGAITDNAGNAYVEAGGARAVDSSVGMVDIWYAKNSASGATIVTITPNPSGTNGVAVVWEFSGLDTVSPLDQVGVLNSQPAPATSPTSGASVTTTAPVEAVVSVTAPQWFIGNLLGGSNFTQDFLLDSPSGSSPYYSTGWAHLITSSTGTYSANWGSWGNIYTSTTASFKLAASYSACDLNEDGTVNILDVQLATDLVPGVLTTTPPCTAPFGQCNAAFAQAVLNNAMGGTCALPVLGVAPSSVTFGNVTVGNSSTQTVTLTGSGTSSTTISLATVSGTGFSISGPSLPLTLTVGQNATFSVTFTPATTGSASGSIAFTSSALDTPFNETLSGTGVAPVSHSVSLSWTPSTTSGVTSYNIYRAPPATSNSSTPATPYPPLGSVLANTCTPAVNPTQCTYTDASVMAGYWYWYYVTAVAGTNESTPSNN